MQKNYFIAFTRFFIRGILGMLGIYFINIFLANQGFDIQVGINFVTFFISACLGIPGVGLLYGILLFKIL